ncbi:MAG: ATP-dependent DNA helicase RecG [Paludibacteraceae bacterium]|nr:ATP-dependent DNA helicase RecG [Paludibacteraceae bacterium]
MNFNDEITYLKGVGPARAKVLEREANIRTVGDLLQYYPYRYVDRSHIYTCAEINDETQYVQLKGTITNVRKTGTPHKERVEATFSDSTGSIQLVWFRGTKYILNRFQEGSTYLVFGKPTRYQHLFNIPHPEVDEATEENERKNLGWMAMYNTTERMKNAGLGTSGIRKLVFTALETLSHELVETLPAYIRDKLGFPDINDATRAIHFPKNNRELSKAQERFKFEELFYIQLQILKHSKFSGQPQSGFVFAKVGDTFNEFYNHHLSFDLTNAQKKVIREIRTDLGSGRQMNRLLQGDVGSGKTLVALLTMLLAVDNGYQACLMAPTEILATQHFHSFRRMLDGLPCSVSLLTGSTSAKERDAIHVGLKSGTLNLLIGTHALIEDNVQFKNLGLAIIDEQHRFGVAQRAKLRLKNSLPPHVLVMTATPIPRTLAMTVYGDLDVSIIDELPPGRKPIKTYHYFNNRRDDLMRFLKQEIDLGRQAYIVYPLIEESAKSDLQAVENGYDYVTTHLPQFKVSMVHGRLSSQQKESEMNKFVHGETQIMVATTVIEVGVNVPNASVMVIEDSQRFGLAQLHQLRGRVGRGNSQSYCILLSPQKLSYESNQRLKTMVATNDGFEIAEADMRLRGPGDMEGTAQSGMPFELKVANLARDGEIVTLARDVAQRVLTADPNLNAEENRVLTFQLRKRARTNIDWSNIS